jgi:hypothetical protein
MIEKKLDQIKELDLNQLKENEVIESKKIEYKRELHLENRVEKKEFLADVSSFANTSGGDLIIGISESNGIPDVIEGLDKDIIDELKGKIEGLLRDGTEPRIKVDIKEVPLSNSKFALIIRVPHSWRSPHRVLLQDKNFYSRNSNGKYQLDVEELRTAFNLSENLIDKIRRFREDRLSNIYSDNAPITLGNTAKTIIHIIPINAFNPGQHYQINQITSYELINGHPSEERYNFDGIVSYNLDGYVQLFKNGIIEAVDKKFTSNEIDGKSIPSGLYEPALIKALKTNLNILNDLFVETPIFIFISLIGVKGYTMAINDQNFKIESLREQHIIDRDVLILPEIILEDYEFNAEKMKLSFDSLWNACGYEYSPFFRDK